MFRYEPTRFSRTVAAFDANEFTCSRNQISASANFGRRDPTQLDFFERKPEKRSLGCCSKSKNGDAPWRLYNTDRYYPTYAKIPPSQFGLWAIFGSLLLFFLGINVVKMVLLQSRVNIHTNQRLRKWTPMQNGHPRKSVNM